jgi:hypothetical protein
MSTVFHLEVEMEDGKTWDVHADQRDFALWELHPQGVPFHQMFDKPYATLQHLAYTAGKRGRLHGFTTFDTFAAAAVEVRRLDDPEETEDPGQPAASAGT